jgi:hypothetical protein
VGLIYNIKDSRKDKSKKKWQRWFLEETFVDLVDFFKIVESGQAICRMATTDFTD